MLELAGARPRLDAKSDVLHLLQDQPPAWRDAFYIKNATHTEGIDQRALRTDRWKQIAGVDGRHALFDLENDPEEEFNIYDTPRDDIHVQFRHFPDYRATIIELAQRLEAGAQALEDAFGIELARRVFAEKSR